MTDNEKEKLDLLIDQNAERQFAKLDWQQLNASISSRLDNVGSIKTFGQRTIIISAAILAAAAVITIALIVTQSFLVKERDINQTLTLTSFGPAKGLNINENNEDNLLARTDPETILLTGQYHLVSNDELLKPHSIWEQKPVCCTN